MFGLLVDILRSAYKTSYGAGGLFEGEYGDATGYNIRLSNTIIPSPFLPPYHKPDLIAPLRMTTLSTCERGGRLTDSKPRADVVRQL
jgi:hypothetical protein